MRGLPDDALHRSSAIAFGLDTALRLVIRSHRRSHLGSNALVRGSNGALHHDILLGSMEGQLGAPFHFAVEFLVLVVALGGAFDALRARRDGAGPWAIGQAIGFLSLAAAEFIHGALVFQADANTTIVALRAIAFGILAFTARPA